MRVTDEMVRSFLTWGRNYGELDSFKCLPDARGRKWHIEIPAAVNAATSDSPVLLVSSPDRIVPAEFVLTNREALAFGYGLAVAGARTETRAEFAAREWGWT